MDIIVRKEKIVSVYHTQKGKGGGSMKKVNSQTSHSLTNVIKIPPFPGVLLFSILQEKSR